VDLREALERRVGLGDAVAGVSHGGCRTIAARGRATASGETAVGSCFRIASLTKVFTATALVLAAGPELATPVVRLLPELAGDWRADPGITVEQVLGQVSGLRESVDAATVAGLGDGPDVLGEVARLVVRAGNERKPGGRWSYYNGNYFLAGALLAKLDGATFEEALARRVLDRWGLGQTGFGRAGLGRAGLGQTGFGQAGFGQAELGQAELGQAELGQAELGQAELGQAELGQAGLGQAGFGQAGLGPPAGAVAGWNGDERLAPIDYPRGRRPSGGLWSSVPDLLTLCEKLLHDRPLLDELGRPRTTIDDPMAYGLGWALGPSGQMFLNGRLSGYRAAMLLVPDEDYASVVLSAQETALPDVAALISDLQRPLTGDDVSGAVEAFAA
jgi:CubicO group peptidase (beta-lactamase class C family)